MNETAIGSTNNKIFYNELVRNQQKNTLIIDLQHVLHCNVAIDKTNCTHRNGYRIFRPTWPDHHDLRGQKTSDSQRVLDDPSKSPIPVYHERAHNNRVTQRLQGGAFSGCSPKMATRVK